MTLTRIPRSSNGLVRLGVKALAGSISQGPAIGLQLNTSAMITTDLHNLTGDPATPLVPGKEAVLDSSKQAVKSATIAAQLAVKAGREYCRIGIALLKPVLGVKHNSMWENAGFRTPSLAMPADPVPMLIQFRRFLEANPTSENASIGFTAAQANAKTTAIQSAELALATAESAKLVAKGQRDFAQRALQKRMLGLRGELAQLLSPESGIWREFGFRRPADRHIPNDVEGVALTAGVPGTVLVKWNAASRAENYRVLWRLTGAPAEDATQVGLLTDRQTLITGLPTGSSVIVGVTARNGSGETEAAEATITVP